MFLIVFFFGIMDLILVIIKIKDNTYNILLNILPVKLMYRKYYIDNVYILVPRFGWSKKQLEIAENFANNLNIEFE